MSTLTRKAWGDLTRHRSRTLLAACTLSIAIASLGFLAVPRLLNTAMNRQVEQSHLYDVGISMRVIDLTPALLSALGRLPDVAAVSPVLGYITTATSAAGTQTVGVFGGGLASASVNTVRACAAREHASRNAPLAGFRRRLRFVVATYSRAETLPASLGYEPYDARLWRLGLSRAGVVTSADRTAPISLRRLRLPRLTGLRRVRFTNRFTGVNPPPPGGRRTRYAARPGGSSRKARRSGPRQKPSCGPGLPPAARKPKGGRQNARRHRNQARKRVAEAGQRAAAANAQTEQILRAADQHSQQLVAHANEHAGQIVAQAKAQADQLLTGTTNQISRRRCGGFWSLRSVTAMGPFSRRPRGTVRGTTRRIIPAQLEPSVR